MEIFVSFLRLLLNFVTLVVIVVGAGVYVVWALICNKFRDVADHLQSKKDAKTNRIN